MKIIIQGTLAELDVCGLLRPDSDTVPARFELANLRLRKNPYSDAYRLCADVIDREGAM
ncbi:hypothetical protein AB0M44_32625 [Streptosporangium subroseum]|uniref:hypothetical protein n=1 Tax=Streptosporangium subroseum TaxID=106412 RepID=UPI00344A1F94